MVAVPTRLYREKLLLHAWIDCFLSGMKLALIGQCDCEVPPPPESDTAAAKADGGDAEAGGAATNMYDRRPVIYVPYANFFRRYAPRKIQ